MIPIHIVNGRGFVYDVEIVKQLREEYHICGILSGILPQFPQQNIFGGLPLQLLPEDIQYLLETGRFFLLDNKMLYDGELHEGEHGSESKKPYLQEPDIYQGSLAVIPAAAKFTELPNTTTVSTQVEYRRPKPERYQIYKYLMQRGYFIMPGLRFGCQFMAYPGDLMRYHSHYNVLGYGWDEQFPILDIVGGGRLATSVKKCWIVGATEPESETPEVFSIEWAGFG